MMTPNGPPAYLPGANLIGTGELVQKMKARDAGQDFFWLIDARGCNGQQTIAQAVCLTENTVGYLARKAPDRGTPLVIFCLDGSCPESFLLASAAVQVGYQHVFWYRGGINAWEAGANQAAAYPISE
jgi:hypothetical protein